MSSGEEKRLLPKIKTKPRKIKLSFYLLFVLISSAGRTFLRTRVHRLLLWGDLGELGESSSKSAETERQQEACVKAEQQGNVTCRHILFQSLYAEKN